MWTAKDRLRQNPILWNLFGSAVEVTLSTELYIEGNFRVFVYGNLWDTLDGRIFKIEQNELPMGRYSFW